MTLLRRESQPISEGQTIIRSQYLYQPPAVAGVQLPATTVTKEIVVVGCGVNYDVNRGVGRPRWVPSNGALVATGRAGVAYESTAGPLEFSLPVASDQWLVVRKNGRAVSSRFVGAAAAAAVRSDDRTARYLNVFADTDLVWQVDNGYLKESLILRSRTAPTEFSILLESPDFAFLASDASQSSFSLNEIRATAHAAKVAGPLLLAPATAKQNHQILIPAPFVVDAHGKRSSLRCFVSRTATGALLYTMRIPASLLTAPALTYPLTVDPSYINVTTATVTLFEAGQTYYIANPIYYTTEQVRIEANAFLKFHPWEGGTDAGSLNFTGIASIRVEGTPYNYAYFTSAYDDSIGENTDADNASPLPPEHNPSPGDYVSALVMQGYAAHLIQYAKFAYASTPIVIDDGQAHVTIEHSIFRNNGDDVYIRCMDTLPVCQISNSLFVGGCQAIHAQSDPEYLGSICVAVTNCTFTGVGTVMDISDDMYESSYELKYNAIAGCDYGINYYQQDPNQMPSFSIDRNGLYSVSSFISSNANIDPGNYVEDETWPFVSDAYGSYYLRSGSPFINYGDCPAGGLSGKTTTALSDGRIIHTNIGGSQEWTLYSGRTDNGLLNLGYHYDPVDWIVQGEVLILESGALHVLPGVTVATSGVLGLGSLTAQPGGSLDMRGTGAQPIRFSSTRACGDKIGADSMGQFFPLQPGRGLGWGGIAVVGDGARTFQYCTIENAFTGVSLQGSADPIENCRFGGCGNGIVDTASASYPRTIKNCLFRDIGDWAVRMASQGSGTVLNCTIANAEIGVKFASAVSGNVVGNSIFLKSRGWGISKVENAELQENHNCFWQNARDTNFTSSSTDLHQDPDFATTTTADLYARFFLQQDSPCIDAGDTSVLVRRLADCTTWRTASADRGLVDIGYHYGPVCRGGYDSDGDGMDDQWEMFFFGSTTARNGTEDDDGDGLNTLQEYLFKSNPLVYDTPVRLYRGAQFTTSTLISDWDASPGTHLQSPRFVFTYATSITIEVRGLQIISPTLTNELKVVSEADTTGVYITLRQTSPGSGVFRSTSEPLYLWSFSLDPAGAGNHCIKVADEEKLVFSFSSIATGVAREVLVDRGEYAGCGVDYFYGEPTTRWPNTEHPSVYAGAHLRCHLFCSGDESFDNQIGNDGPYNGMALFIRRAGGNVAGSGQADILHIVTHGDTNGDLYDDGGPKKKVFDPDDPMTGVHPLSEWNQDVDWIFLHACDALQDNSPYGFQHWRSTLRGTPRRAHGLLGAKDPLWGGPMTVQRFWAFLDPAWSGGHKTFLDAYKIASSGDPWAVYYRWNHRNDKLDEISPDNDEENPLYAWEGIDYIGRYTSFTERWRTPLAAKAAARDEGESLTETDLARVGGAGLILPRTIRGRKIFPSVRDGFPLGASVTVSPWGEAVHVRDFRVAGRACSYTADQAMASARVFAEKELPVIANRVKWRGASAIRWGTHRERESLVLQTAGYAIVGELTYAGVPILHDGINITILGEDVEFVSITCHDVIVPATETLTVENCQTVVERALPEIRGLLGLGSSYAVLEARLVFVSHLEQDSAEGKEAVVEYRPAWQVVFDRSPGRSDRASVRFVFLDAASGNYIGHMPR